MQPFRGIVLEGKPQPRGQLKAKATTLKVKAKKDDIFLGLRPRRRLQPRLRLNITGFRYKVSSPNICL